MRRAARTDSTQTAIVAALRDAGAFVYPIGRPVDLLVYFRGWHLLECKSSRRKRKDQETQRIFCETFDVPRVTTASEALQAIGAVKEMTTVSYIKHIYAN